MYKNKERETKALFKEFLAFGGQLDESNRWLRIAKLIPWGALEDEYGSHFSHTGRPATDGRLFLGLILLKHMTGLSDRELLEEVLENLYLHAEVLRLRTVRDAADAGRQHIDQATQKAGA